MIFLGGGQDSAFLNGSGGNTTVSLQPASAGIASTLTDILNGVEVTALVYGTQYVLATNGGGNNTALLSDSSGTGVATLKPDDATLTGPGFSLEARGFPTVHAYATKSGDVAKFSDLPNDVSTLVATSQSAQLTSKVGTTTISNYAQGFTSCYATASNTADQAQLTDSQGQSALTASGKTSTLYADNGSYLIQVNGFGSVQVFGKVGGGDKATMSDAAGSATGTFTATPNAASFTGPGFSNTASNFSSVVALAKSAADTATLSDAANNNTLVDKPLDVLFFGVGFSLEAKQFTTTTVNSLSAGIDTALLLRPGRGRQHPGRLPEPGHILGQQPRRHPGLLQYRQLLQPGHRLRDCRQRRHGQVLRRRQPGDLRQRLELVGRRQPLDDDRQKLQGPRL